MKWQVWAVIWGLLAAAPIADAAIIVGKLCYELRWSWWTLAAPPALAILVVGVLVAAFVWVLESSGL